MPGRQSLCPAHPGHSVDTVSHPVIPSSCCNAKNKKKIKKADFSNYVSLSYAHLPFSAVFGACILGYSIFLYIKP